MTTNEIKTKAQKISNQLFDEAADNITFVLVGGMLFTYILGIYVGKRIIDPKIILKKSPDLWLQIHPAGVKALKTGSALLFEAGSELGDLILAKVKTPRV